MTSAVRIMIVDNFKQWRATLRSILEAVENFRVVAEAATAEEAIEKAGRVLPDIVLLDIGLPLLNGIEAVPKIRRTSSASKVIFLTQENDSDVAAAALATGAEAYLLKSNVVRELKNTIDAVRQIPRWHLDTPHPDPRKEFPELRVEVEDDRTCGRSSFEKAADRPLRDSAVF